MKKIFKITTLVLIALVLIRSITLLTIKIDKSEPFPDNIRGCRVKWIPDIEIRNIAHRMEKENVLSVELNLLNHGSSGILNVSTHNKNKIQLLIYGLKLALKRADEPYLKETSMGEGIAGGMASFDQMMISYIDSRSGKLNEEKIIFYADIIEGEKVGMPRGTISPEFQNALRALGVPKIKPSNFIDGFILDSIIFIKNL